MRRAILLISHGSRSGRAREEITAEAERLKERSGFKIAQCAFLDVEHPTILEGFESCIRSGASEIVVLQNFLNSGRHVLEDIPERIEEARRKFPDVRIIVTPFVGAHRGMTTLFLDLLRGAVEGRSP